MDTVFILGVILALVPFTQAHNFFKAEEGEITVIIQPTPFVGVPYVKQGSDTKPCGTFRARNIHDTINYNQPFEFKYVTNNKSVMHKCRVDVWANQIKNSSVDLPGYEISNDVSNIDLYGKSEVDLSGMTIADINPKWEQRSVTIFLAFLKSCKG